ncbi:MAG: hypothetical protein AB8B65_00420 [Kordia sp.]|uniref:hypothetical protein n=1 Tax=Kordia sp. TaxID=1965332 RepID=UPI00385CEE69
MNKTLNTIWNSLLTGVVFSLTVSGIIYLVLAMMYAWYWSIEISEWFVFVIIRAVVVVFLTIPSLLIMPFKEDTEILAYIKTPALIALGIGLLYGFLIGKSKPV